MSEVNESELARVAAEGLEVLSQFGQRGIVTRKVAGSKLHTDAGLELGLHLRRVEGRPNRRRDEEKLDPKKETKRQRQRKQTTKNNKKGFLTTKNTNTHERVTVARGRYFID
jgi:hypothetical protein